MPHQSHHQPDRPQPRDGGTYDRLRDLQARRHATRGRPQDGEGTYDGLRELQAGRGGGRSGRRPPGWVRRWPRRTLIAVNAFVAVCLLTAAAAYGYVRHELGNVTKVDVAGLSAARNGPFTILIVGSDTRDLTGSGNAAFGTAAETPGQRSDTIMLARVVPKTHSMTLLSIPRDLWVNVAGMGQTRINSAFNTGPSLLISTIQHDLGIPVNHYVAINFDTFQAITDAVGGVKVWFPTPAKDTYSLLSVPKAGCVNLTGAQALAFARSRHYEYLQDGQWITQGLSDLARIQRQQFYVKKMISKAEQKLTNPVALNDVLSSVTRNLTVDRNFSTGLMLTLAKDFHSADVASIPTLTLPTYNEDVGGAAVLGLQQPQAGQMISSFVSLGTTPTKTKTSTAKKSTAKAKARPAKAKSPATTATTLAGSHLPVVVANGSGTTGQAGVAASALAGLGYAATVTGQTPGYGFAHNTIDYAPDGHVAAQQLAAQLNGGATLELTPSLASSPYVLELVTGHDYAGVVGQQPPATTTVPSTTAPSSSPAGAVASYPLPGPTPTAAELAAC